MVEEDGDAGDSLLRLGLDSLLWTNVSLFASDVAEACEPHPLFSAAREASPDASTTMETKVPAVSDAASGRAADVFVLKTHPVRCVRVCGVVVSIERSRTFTVFSVDDGTGILPCLQWEDSRRESLAATLAAMGDGERTYEFESAMHAAPGLGDLVVVMGRLAQFRDRRQVVVASIDVAGDPNAEAAEWLAAVALHNDVYDQQIAVPDALAAAVIDAYGSKDSKESKESNDADEFTKESIEFLIARVRTFIDGLPPAAAVPFADVRADPLVRRDAAIHIHARSLPFRKDKDKESNKNNDKENNAISRVSATAIDTALVHVFATLVSRGVIFLSDEDRDLYERVSHSATLSSHVLAAVRNERGVREPLLGVPSDLIILRVREHEMFGRIPKPQIEAAIASLELSGDIYEASAGRYRCMAA